MSSGNQLAGPSVADALVETKHVAYLVSFIVIGCFQMSYIIF